MEIVHGIWKHLEIMSEIRLVPGKLHTTVVQVDLVIQDFQISLVVNVDNIWPKMCTGSHTILYQTK